jgi:cell division protein FtsZ
MFEMNSADFNEFMPKTLVIGVGGQGSNLVHRLINSGITSASTLALNTDAAHLNIIRAHKKILIGKNLTKGFGAGGFPEVAAKCAEFSRAEIESAIEGYDLIFIAAGMGGGTGTGAAPIVAEMAKAQGSTVLATVTYPFALERSRKLKAEAGITELSRYADTIIVIENDRLLSYVPNLPMEKAFEVVDNITGNAVKNIADAITLPSLINLDYADLKSVVSNAGTALINIGVGSGVDRVEQVIKSTRSHPLLTADVDGAKGALVHVMGGSNLTISEATRIGEGVTEGMANNANVIFGARMSQELNAANQIRVMSVITGVKARFGEKREHEHAESLRLENLEKIY